MHTALRLVHFVYLLVNGFDCSRRGVCVYVSGTFCGLAGINFARDGMVRKDWLALVAVHSDAWLLSVAFYYGAKLDANARQDT